MKVQKKLPITDERMTRFWITLQHGVDFVLQNFERMHGGEIFVPKIPSIRIVDLAQAMLSNKEFEVIGIRPGEKLHEIMCPEDESMLTLEFNDHFVIVPTITFTQRGNSYEMGERGEWVKSGFAYCSGTNSDFLSIEKIREYNKLI